MVDQRFHATVYAMIVPDRAVLQRSMVSEVLSDFMNNHIPCDCQFPQVWTPVSLPLYPDSLHHTVFTHD